MQDNSNTYLEKSSDDFRLRTNKNVLPSEKAVEGKLPYYLTLFLISPVLSAISGIANYKNNCAKLIIIFFIGVVGYHIISTPGKDSYQVMQEFESHYLHLSVTGFLDELIGIIAFQGSSISVDEPYMSVVSYGIAQFTNSARWLFLFLGLVYGYFYTKGISLVYDEIEKKWNLVIGILFIVFISIISLDGLNAPRTHTANWVFFCGAFLYLKTSNFKYLFLVLLAPLIHFGFWAMLFPFLSYLLIGNRKYIYIFILALSFFASAHMNFVEPILTSTELGQTKMQQYTGEIWEERLEREASRNLSFHAKYYTMASEISIQFMLVACLLFAGYVNGKYHDDLQYALGGLSILLLSFSNFVSSTIPVLGNRLFLEFSMFALAYLIRLYTRNYHELSSRRWIVYICIPAILLFLFTQWSIISDFIDFKVIFSPISYPFLGDDPISIKEFIRKLLEV